MAAVTPRPRVFHGDASAHVDAVFPGRSQVRVRGGFRLLQALGVAGDDTPSETVPRFGSSTENGIDDGPTGSGDQAVRDAFTVEFVEPFQRARHELDTMGAYEPAMVSSMAGHILPMVTSADGTLSSTASTSLAATSFVVAPSGSPLK